MKDLNKIKEHWFDIKTESLRDKNLQQLEQVSITESLQNISTATLLDLGCGDASDTIKYIDFADKILACDYSDAMLTKAEQNIENHKDQIELFNFNLLDQELKTNTDTIITKRVLINLGNFENQKMAIKKIYDALPTGGYYLMLECSIDGLNNMNQLRSQFDLPEIPEPFHNCFFELPTLKDHLEPYFEIEKVCHFSTYFYLTRVYNPSVGMDHDFAKSDQKAREHAEQFDFLKNENIGGQFLMVLKKR